jgi:hypothetical protein
MLFPIAFVAVLVYQLYFKKNVVKPEAQAGRQAPNRRMPDNKQQRRGAPSNNDNSDID